LPTPAEAEVEVEVDVAAVAARDRRWVTSGAAADGPREAAASALPRDRRRPGQTCNGRRWETPRVQNLLHTRTSLRARMAAASAPPAADRVFRDPSPNLPDRELRIVHRSARPAMWGRLTVRHCPAVAVSRAQTARMSGTCPVPAIGRLRVFAPAIRPGPTSATDRGSPVVRHLATVQTLAVAIAPQRCREMWIVQVLEV
jgi:hypothetical protein